MNTEPTVLPPPPPTPKPPAHKSTELAVLLALLPGLGHVYLGLYQRGIAFCVAFVALLWLDDHADLPGLALAFTYFFNLFDAYRMAKALKTEPAHLEPPAPRSDRPRAKENLTLGVVLVVAGAVLLFGQFFHLDLSFLADWWPLGLILIGLWLVFRDLRSRKEAPPQGGNV